MKNRHLFLFSLAVVFTACSEGPPPLKKHKFKQAKIKKEDKTDSTITQPSSEFERYDALLYAREFSKPGGAGAFFRSAKIDALMKKSKPPKEEKEGYLSYVNDVLDESAVAKLTPQELLYYCLYYPASFTQNCSVAMLSKSTTDTIFISPYLPSADDSKFVSEIQKKQLEAMREPITALMNKYLEQADTIAIECLELIVDMKLTATIPTLCKKADLKKNLFVYTALYKFVEDAKMVGEFNDALNFFRTDRPYGEAVITEKDAKAVADAAMVLFKSRNS